VPSPPGHLQLQRRPRLGFGLCPHGGLRPAPGRAQRRRQPAAAALQDRGQPGNLARLHRPRLRGCHGHRLQPRGFPRSLGPRRQRQRRSAILQRIHPPLALRQQPAQLAPHPGRRELWHLPLRRAGRHAARTPHSGEWRGAALQRVESLHPFPLEQVVQQSKDWASTKYEHYLDLGDALQGQERQTAIAEMARFTGLRSAFIDNWNLRIGTNRTPGALNSDYDPSDLLSTPYLHEFIDYLKNELNYKTTLEYGDRAA